MMGSSVLQWTEQLISTWRLSAERLTQNMAEYWGLYQGIQRQLKTSERVSDCGNKLLYQKMTHQVNREHNQEGSTSFGNDQRAASALRSGMGHANLFSHQPHYILLLYKYNRHFRMLTSHPILFFFKCIKKINSS